MTPPPWSFCERAPRCRPCAEVGPAELWESSWTSPASSRTRYITGTTLHATDTVLSTNGRTPSPPCVEDDPNSGAHCAVLTVPCSLCCAHCAVLTVLCSLCCAHFAVLTAAVLTVLRSLCCAHCVVLTVLFSITALCQCGCAVLLCSLSAVVMCERCASAMSSVFVSSVVRGRPK